MKSATVSDIKVELKQGDIANQTDIEAVVNAANAQLRTGGGVAGAIHRAAGSGLAKECRPLAPIKPGEAVITSGHQLPNSYVIHCLGPVYGRDKPEAELLASCYREALALAEKNDIVSLALPALSTGAFGYPTEEAAEVALETVVKEAEDLATVKLIRFVLYSGQDFKIHQQVLGNIINRRG